MREEAGKSRALARTLRRRMTNAEVILWSFIRKKAIGWRFRRQHPIGPYVADFACVRAKLVIEVDGATHWTVEELSHDARRTRSMEAAGWRVLRVSNRDVYENMDGVWLTISHALGPPPSRSRTKSETGLPPQAGEENG